MELCPSGLTTEELEWERITLAQWMHVEHKSFYFRGHNTCYRLEPRIDTLPKTQHEETRMVTSCACGLVGAWREVRVDVTGLAGARQEQQVFRDLNSDSIFATAKDRKNTGCHPAPVVLLVLKEKRGEGEEGWEGGADVTS